MGASDETPTVAFCPICATYDYLTPDNPHHQDVFHADRSLTHVNYSLIVDRVRALEHTVQAQHEQIARLAAAVGTLIARTAPDLIDDTPGSPWATDDVPTKK